MSYQPADMINRVVKWCGIHLRQTRSSDLQISENTSTVFAVSTLSAVTRRVHCVFVVFVERSLARARTPWVTDCGMHSCGATHIWLPANTWGQKGRQPALYGPRVTYLVHSLILLHSVLLTILFWDGYLCQIDSLCMWAIVFIITTQDVFLKEMYTKLNSTFCT